MMRNSASNQPPNELLSELLGAYCNGQLSEDQTERFNAALLDDRAAREEYLKYMAVEAELHACHSPGASHAADSDLIAEPALAEQTSHSSVASTIRISPLAIAASLVGVAVLSSALTLATGMLGESDAVEHGAHVQDEQLGEQHQGAGAIVARIAATRNCRWSQPSGGVGFGADLAAGQSLQLDAGLAEITFNSGATIILEGPASLDINERDALLVSGRLAATVPEQARRFRVRTARVGVSGFRSAAEETAFGLFADGRGGGEVHVFDGRMQAHLLSPAGDEVRSVLLNSSEAVRVRPASTTLSRFHADGDGFIRSLFSPGGPHNGLYAYEGFDYPAGPLSWQNGGFGWAGPWADIEAGQSVSGDSVTGQSTNLVLDGSLVPAQTPMDQMPLVGNRSIQTAQKNRIRRAIGTSIGGVFDSAGLVENRDGHRLIGRDSKTIYVSFLQRVDKLDDVFYGFELHRGDGNANRVLCIGNGADGAGYGATSNYNAYGARNYPRLGDESTDVNFLVVKIEFGAGDRDQVAVYRNPESLLDESQCQVDAVLRGNFAFDRISLGNFDGQKRHEIDEIRLGTNFRAVTGHLDRPGKRLDRRVARRSPAEALFPTPTGSPLLLASLRY